MQDIFIQVTLGWPAIILSLLLAFGGLFFKKWKLLALGGLVALPFSIFYMGGYLNSYLIGAALTLGHFAAAFSVAKKKMVIAWVLMLPFTALVVLLAYAVLSQQRP